MTKIISILKNLRTHYANRNNLIISIVGIMILNAPIFYYIKNSNYRQYTPEFHIFLGSYEDQPLYKLSLFQDLINSNTNNMNFKNEGIFEKDYINDILETKIIADKTGFGISIKPPPNLNDKNYNAIRNYFMVFFKVLDKSYIDKSEVISNKIKNIESAIATLTQLRDISIKDSGKISEFGSLLIMQSTFSINTQIVKYQNEVLDLSKSLYPPVLIKPVFTQFITENRKFLIPLNHPILFIFCLDIFSIILAPSLFSLIKRNKYLLK
jgi:hypothetical protein